MLQLAHPKVAQPKPRAFRPRICHWLQYSIRHECQTALPRPGKYIHLYIGKMEIKYMVQWVEWSPMVREPRVQSQVESYQRLFFKWYLIPPCLTLSIIRYVSRVKWSNPGKGVAPSSTLRCSSYWKGSHQVALDYSRQLYFYLGYSQLILHKVIGSDESLVFMVSFHVTIS